MLPIVAVQIDPGASAPVLEQHLLRACSAGLERARCVSSRASSAQAPKGVALVSWDGADHASIEVGLAGDEPRWISRELRFAPADPEVERWRAVGFTIALLADDPRFWEAPALAEPEAEAARAEPGAPLGGNRQPPSAARVELRGLTGSGVVSGAWRWGAELRVAVPLTSFFFVTGSVDYSLARDGALDMRWLDVTLGAGIDAGTLFAGTLFAGTGARLRLELLGENVAATLERDTLTDRATAWVPGVSLGSDLYWTVGDAWSLSARADAFWLDGSTPIASAGQRLGASAGAGVLLGLGAGYFF